MFPKIVHKYFFLFGVFSLAFGMMIGAVPTSVPQFVLLINWLIEGEYKRKWQSLKSNKLFWILESVFWIHVLGLIYTQDIKAGLSDIQIKLPLMILPLVLLSSEPLNAKEIRITLFSFLLGCICNATWCLGYSFLIHHHEVIRSTSRFMSHIRLGLYLNMGIVVTLYFYRDFSKLVYKTLFALLALYFLLVMYFLGLASGLVIFFILLVITSVLLILKQKFVWKAVTLILITTVSTLLICYVKKINNHQFVIVNAVNNTPLKQSLSGKHYLHFDTTGQKENGYYVQINIQLEELQKEWKLLCPKDTFSFPPKPYNLNRYSVLIRYLASMGLTKDSAGVAQLGQNDVDNIENNIANYQYSNWSYLHQRTYELVNEYDNFISDKNVNGQSVTMRFYFWKAALFSIRENPVFGVGTGDVKTQMNRVYENTKSPLEINWRKRPHNQFLTFTVAFGFLGLCILLFGLFYPVFHFRKQLTNMYYPFMVIYLISFLAEDTIETQAGATFFAFFNTFFLSLAFFKRQQSPADSLVSH